MKLSLIQMNCGSDRDTNVARASDFIDRAAKDKPDLIVLPEFFNNLYFAQYRDYKYVQWAEPDDGFSMARIKEKAKQHKVYIIATLYEQEQPGSRDRAGHDGEQARAGQGRAHQALLIGS